MCGNSENKTTINKANPHDQTNQDSMFMPGQSFVK